MSKRKYCPFSRTASPLPCRADCAWYDEESGKCIMRSIESALWTISADLTDISDRMQERYTITEKGREYLKGVGKNDRD